jgi:uncharacterized protein YfaS (alpha-2-macroglobulin family)
MRNSKLTSAIIILFAIFFANIQSNAQQPMKNTDYASLWAKVQDYDNKGLPESAMTTVNEIYAKAKNENDAQQLVKAIIHILKYTDYKEEDAFIKNLNRVEKEAKDAVFPVKPLLHSMLAEVYWHYYQSNLWSFNQRTETVNFKNDDISTWSLEQLIAATIKNYQLSLNDAERSKATKINIYDAVLYEGNEKGRVLRPTLYDFLAHRAIDFYMSEEPDITKPAYSFTINSADYLSDAETFCTLQIQTKDTMAYKYYAMKMLQDLISFHKNDNDKDALMEIDLKRLQYVKQYLALPDKQDLYLNALQKLEQKYIHLPVSTMVTYKIAEVWAEKGSEYKPLQGDEHKWDIKKAYDICDEAIKRFPKSDGAIMAYNFQKSLLIKSSSATIEKVNVPNLPFRTLVHYKNFSNLYWRAVKVSREDVRAERKKWQNNYNVDREQKFIEYFTAKSVAKSGQVALPDDKDYQQHSTEIKIEGMPEGDYVILFSPNPEFTFSGSQISYAFTTISNISYIHRNTDGGTTDLYVLNRTTGEPISGATTQVFFNVYNSKSNEYEQKLLGTYTSDANGYINVPYLYKKFVNSYYSTYYINISWNNDKISSQDIDGYDYNYSGQIYQNTYYKAPIETRTIFFLDRAIYRPGQTLYFKGLVYSTGGDNPEIIKNQNYNVTFYDVNQQVVAQKLVTTNEYGTFNGTFITPNAGLMGQMHLEIDDNSGSNVYFSVEEYKRPKFEVKFDPVKGSFRLGEIIKATGKAQAYSGANIDGANVKYRVLRKARFPWWWWCWYGYYPTSPEMEITNGTTQTDAEGKFSIDFKAIPDESVDKKSSPTFYYTVYADVTDINGETHSNQISVGVGYKALVVGVDINDIDLSKEEALKDSFSIITNNLAGEFEPAKGTIKIWKLKSPERAFRSRMWERADKFTMTRDEYYKNFPHDMYADESNFYKWEKQGNEVFNLNFDSSTGKEFSIKNLQKWDLGKYQLEITGKDKYGEDVKEVAYFEVFNSSSKAMSFPAVHQMEGLKTTCEPGEKAVLQIGSSEKITALYEIERDGKVISKQRLELNNNKQLLEIPVLEEYRGNIAVHYIFVKDNRLYKEAQIITVPYSNKELGIKFESFRDKLQPGQEEQWKIKITDKKGDKAMAEMVATLYDVSLDAFRAHGWYANFYQSLYARLQWQSSNGFEREQFKNHDKGWNNYTTKNYYGPNFDQLNWFGVNLYSYRPYGGFALEEVASAGMVEHRRDGRVKSMAPQMAKKSKNVAELADEVVLDKEEERNASDDEKKVTPPPFPGDAEKTKADFGDVKVRKNFNETAFFYPTLQTNENGEIIVNFTIPEALTRWKMLGFAHTPDLKSGSIINQLVTQKDLMVVPNQPRFFRENDKMAFSVKVTSLVDKELSGNAQLEFFDAITMKPIDELMNNVDKQKPFSLKAKQSSNIEWNIEIPEGIQAITYRVVAKADNFSDGEEMILPVVTNRMMVTETLPLPIRGNQSKTFKLEKLLNNTSSTLRNHRYTLEFTSNPAWYAIQALPYLMEYPYECVEQTFSRYYANSIASHIANSNPKIKRVFDTWATIQPDALLSNLEKNQELKTALLEETPWVLNAKDESQRKRNVALLFDLNKMSNELERALKKIMDAQTGNGGFTWFPGFPDDWYITQHIAAGMGHLDAMGVKSVRTDARVWEMTTKAIGYLDRKMEDRYEYLKSEAKKRNIKLEEYHLDYIEIHYLYTRSYFRDVEIPGKFKDGYNYFLGQAKKYWLQSSIYMQGMMALALHRSGDTQTPKSIIKSLRERALNSEEMGMYWKFDYGYYWYQAPVETQALMIEVFDEVAADIKAVEDLKVWLLKQKQTQDWRTTKATVEACYALLRRGSDALASDKLVEIKVGDEKIDPSSRPDTKVEAGTGYFKTAWTASEITPKMGEIKVTKADDGVAWGAVYWQYFEQLDKITPAETPLKLKKQLFLQENTDRGPVITPIAEGTALQVGDLVKVRIELRVDRTMEYIHLKDMRAAGFEPVQTLSTYKYQDGLWYYESPRDLATNFFIGWLPKGTYVFEYPLRVSQKGDFSNGITTIQCMYAPEFSSHSEGVRVNVK